MAARMEPAQVQAAHQSLHHVVAKAAWDDAAVLRAVRQQVVPAIERHGLIAYWIVDGSSFPKKGQHSVGVARQYCGQLGKQDNCQVAVSLSVANDQASLPIAYRLYLPQAWAEDPIRRAKAGVPEAITFQTKMAIALDQIRQARADGVPGGVVLGDVEYGDDTELRAGVAALDLSYVLAVRSGTSVWPPGLAPLSPTWSGQGRPPQRLRRSPEHQPVSVKTLATAQPLRTWRTVTWREGSQAALSSRFAALRVRPAHRDHQRREPWPEEWLLIEWPRGEAEPTKYWFSNLPAHTPLKHLVHTAKGALADRAGLSGTQARDRARPLRGPRLAGLSSPCQPVHRSVWVFGSRTLSFPPSAAICPRADRGTCATPRLPAKRRPPSALSAM